MSPEADLTFRALLVAVDDYGRLDARPSLLKAALFPARDAFTPQMIEQFVRELASIEDPPVVLYVVSGRPYLALTGWEKHRGAGKRGGNSKFPSPTDDPRIPRESADPRKSPSVGRGTSIEGRGARDEGRIAASPPAERAAAAAPTPASQAVESAPPEPRKPKRRVLTDPPIALDEIEQKALVAWCELAHPALVPRLHALVTACLDFHRAKGNRHADWLATCRTWVRNDAEGRFGSPRAPNSIAARAQERAENDRQVEQQAAALIRANREARERAARQRIANNGVAPADVRDLRPASDPGTHRDVPRDDRPERLALAPGGGDS